MFGSIKTFFSAIGSFFGYADTRQKLEAGKAIANAEHSGKVLENVKTAKEAVDGLSDNDELERLRDDFSRD